MRKLTLNQDPNDLVSTVEVRAGLKSVFEIQDSKNLISEHSLQQIFYAECTDDDVALQYARSPRRGGRRGFVGRALLFLLPLFFLLPACGEDNRDAEWGYQKALAKGLRSNERTDDLLLDLEFGMTGSEVSQHLDRLSAKQPLEVTPAGYSTEFELPDLPGRTTLNVIPVFTDKSPGKLYALDFSIIYEGEMQSSKKSFVLQEVTKDFRLRFGTDFFVLRDDELNRTIVQVRDNRRLAFWRGPAKNVTGRFVDLSVAPKDPLKPAGSDRPQMGMNSNKSK